MFSESLKNSVWNSAISVLKPCIPVCFLVKLDKPLLLLVPTWFYVKFMMYSVMIPLPKRGESFCALY